MSAVDVVRARAADAGSRVIRRSALESPLRVVRVGLLGYGQIGQAVAAVADRERERLAESGIELQCVGALVRDVRKTRSGPSIDLSTDARDVLGADLDVVVEVLGGVEPARRHVADALRAGIAVITANKTLVATHGQELRALADAHDAAFACDAAVLAGVPFLGSLARRPLVSDARRIAGIINGTSHFVLGAIERGATFEDALADATARGYAEPDSSADTSGRDAAEKLTILLHLAGCTDVAVSDLRCLPLDAIEPADFVAARELGGTIKPVALASLGADAPGAWVGPAFVPASHPFARLDGVANALELTGANGQTVFFAGPGAGPEATAITIIDDIVETMAGNAQARELPRPARPPRRASRTGCAGATLRTPAPSSWFVSVRHAPSLAIADVAEFLASRRVPALQIVTQDAGLALRTSPASWRAIQQIVDALAASGARVLAVPCV